MDMFKILNVFVGSINHVVTTLAKLKQKFMRSTNL